MKSLGNSKVPGASGLADNLKKYSRDHGCPGPQPGDQASAQKSEDEQQKEAAKRAAQGATPPTAAAPPTASAPETKSDASNPKLDGVASKLLPIMDQKPVGQGENRKVNYAQDPDSQKFIQDKMNAAGTQGASYEDTVKAYQKANGLKVDGKAGPATLRKLQSDPKIQASAKTGDKATQQFFDHKPSDSSSASPAPSNSSPPVTKPSGVNNAGGVPSTVSDAARALLNNPNVSFKPTTTGSDKQNMERLARGQPAIVGATGAQVTPNLRMMQSLVAMAQKGPIQINAMTQGVHSRGSAHYRGQAVDLSTHVGNTAQIVGIAGQFGGRRNSETDHIHLSF
jgi:peptidoglycan hydrolase-like protein with peptidoglycan-binding domain